MKKYHRISLFLALIILLSACYSPKQKVEKDKHPDVPEFPVFKDDAIKLKQLTTYEFHGSRDNSIHKRGNLVFVLSYGVKSVDGKTMEKSSVLTIFKGGQLIRTHNWDEYSGNLSDVSSIRFFNENGDLYIGNTRFVAPAYTKRETLAVVELDSLMDEFYHGSIGKEYEERATVLRAKQQKIMSRIKTIRKVYSSLEHSGVFSSPRNSLYLCNEGTRAQFLLNGDCFSDFNLDSKGEPLYDVDWSYVNQFKSTAKKEPKNSEFGSSDLQDDKLLKETESIVIGNEWFSTGNHFSGSAGYSQIYLRYYELHAGSIKAKTKVSEKKSSLPEVITLSDEHYFFVFDAKMEHFAVYYWKS